MKLLEIVKTANNNLKRSKLRTFLTISAIFVGAFTLSLTNGMSSGVNKYIDKQLKNVTAKDSVVVTKKPAGSAANPLGAEVPEYNPERSTTAEFGVDYLDAGDLEKIESTPYTKEIFPIYQVKPEYITAGDKKYVGQLTTYTPGLELDLVAGTLISQGDDKGLILPQGYAETIYGSAENAVGKELTIVMKEPTGQTLTSKGMVRAVAANSLINNGSVQASIALVKELNEFQTKNTPALQGKQFAAVIQTEQNLSSTQLNEVKDSLDRNGYKGETLEDQIGNIREVIKGAQLGLNLFGAIALLAASFGIINTLLMGVYERTREIGLMKALGMSRRQLFRIFSFEAISLGFWGGGLGILASMGVGALINSFVSNNVFKELEGFTLLSFPPLRALSVLLFIMLIAFLAGVLPSRKASRLNPIDALRYE